MKNLILLISAVFFFNISFSQVLSEWRGMGRTGNYNESGLLKTWKEGGPDLLWSIKDIPKGYSSPAVAHNIVFTTGIKDTTDVLLAIDAKGNLIYQTAYGRAWNGTFTDSRCTPTVEGNNVYVSSGLGDIACIDAISGKIKWTVKASEKFEGTFGDWGISESLLIVDDKLIYSPGGKKTTVVALNKNTGETVWMSESIDDTPAYASPVLIKENDKNLILTVLSTNLIVVDADNGEIISKYNYAEINNEKALKVWDGAPYTNTNTPIYNNGNIYLTSGYNHIGAMFKLSDDFKSLSLLWQDTVLDVHHGGVVLLDGYIYGSNWINNRKGNWCCIDWKTGETKYEHKWQTKGSIISADGMLYCYEEKRGNIALVEASPEEFKISGTFKTPFGKGPHWSHLVIKDGVLYVRHEDALMAYDISAKSD